MYHHIDSYGIIVMVIRLNILVTNDDGYLAYGIRLLANKLKRFGNVVIIAPDSNRSAISHAMNIHTPVTFKRVEDFLDIPVYTTSGNPSDCVRMGLNLLDIKFDIVFSGINSGLNLGTDVHYSGTCAGAREATINSVPGISISTGRENFKIVENEIDILLNKIFDGKLYSNDYFLNVNFPKKTFDKSKDFIIAKSGKKIFITKFKNENGLVIEESHELIKDTNIDTDVYLHDIGYTTIVPISIDPTEYDAYKKLKGQR